MCCGAGGNLGFIPPIVYSLQIAPSIIAICAIAEGLRKLVDGHVPNKNTKALWLEAIASFEMCANASELGVIAETYDLMTYLVYLIGTSIWYSCKWNDASACPYVPLEEAYGGSCEDYKEAFKKIAAQLAGGFVGLYYINYVYSLEIISPHVCRAWARCCSQIHVAFLLALLIEATFTCAYRILTKFISKSGTTHPAFKSCMAGILLVLIGREFSQNAFCYAGGNLNPVLTTVTKFNCRGTSVFKHFCVYWVGPCLGSIASLHVYPYLFK